MAIRRIDGNQMLDKVLIHRMLANTTKEMLKTSFGNKYEGKKKLEKLELQLHILK